MYIFETSFIFPDPLSALPSSDNHLESIHIVSEIYLEKAAVAGKNSIEIEVISTLNRSQRELFSMFVPIEPLGIVGPVEIYTKK